MQSILEVPPALAQPAAGLIGAALPRLAAIARQRADRLLEPPLGLLARALRSLLVSASGLGLVDQVLALERILGSAGAIVVRAGPTQLPDPRKVMVGPTSVSVSVLDSGAGPPRDRRHGRFSTVDQLPSARPGRMGRGILSMALAETQQRRMLERLRSAGQQPVTLDQLRAGGIDFPAVVIGELELNGYVIERVYEDGRQIGVRLLETEAPEPPASRRRPRWRRDSR